MALCEPSCRVTFLVSFVFFTACIFFHSFIIQFKQKVLKMVGAVQQLNSTKEFQEKVKSVPGPVIVDFFADWCPPCKMIAPKYVKMSEEFSNIAFYKVNVDSLNEVASECGISAMPTFQIFVNGVKSGEVRGADESGIRALLSKHSGKSSSGGGGSGGCQAERCGCAHGPSTDSSQAQAQKVHPDVAKYTHELGKDQTNTDLYIGRAKAYMDSKMYKEAMADCKNALHLDPDNPKLHELRKELKKLMA